MAAGNTAMGTGVFLSDERIAILKERVAQKVEPTYTAYLRLKRDADAEFGRQPSPPAVWYVPGFYKDKDGHNKAKGVLENDANAAYGLALMYRISGDTRYGFAAARLIDGWTTGLKSLSRKDDSMLSFSYHFPAFIFAASMLDHSDAWPAAREEAFKDFVRTKAIPMNTMGRENNWGNWGLVLVLSGAAYLQDHALFESGIARWKHFIDKQLAPDGHLPLEVIRNNGLGERGIWYSNFCLRAQTIAAEVARVQGVDLYDYQSPSGRTLRKAFECVIPWVADPKTFPYYKGKDPKGQLETDYISYWEILNAHWPQPAATAIIARMRPLTAIHCTPYLTFTHGDLLKP